MVKDKHISRIMVKMGIASTNAWIRTIMDISRRPRLHGLIVIALPPMMEWTCDDEKEVCELYLFNLMEELENLGLQGITRVQGNKYHVEIYEVFRL